MDIFVINGKSKAELDKVLNNYGHAYIGDDFCYYLDENSSLLSQNVKVLTERDYYDVTFAEGEEVEKLALACDELLSSKLASDFDSKFKKDMVNQLVELKRIALIARENNLNLVFMGD